MIELRDRSRKVSQQERFTISYKEREIGTLIPDLIVDELVIVDTKVVTAFNESHIAQMTGYLSHTGLRLGLLLNFSTTADPPLAESTPNCNGNAS